MIAEKPPLKEVYLVHAGVKGMKWGRRKKRPDEAERKEFFSKANLKKAGKVAAVVAGVAIVAGVMTQAGRTRMTDLATTNYVQTRTARVNAGKTPFGPLTDLYKTTKTSTLAGWNSADTQSLYREGARSTAARSAGLSQLVDKTWRDQARMARLTREIDTTNNSLLDGTMQRLIEAQSRRG